jgi:hypothetical protein
VKTNSCALKWLIHSIRIDVIYCNAFRATGHRKLYTIGNGIVGKTIERPSINETKNVLGILYRFSGKSDPILTADFSNMVHEKGY